MFSLFYLVLWITFQESIAYYKVPPFPKQTRVPQELIRKTEDSITIENHPIMFLGENEFSRYKMLRWLKLNKLQIGDNIASTAFMGELLSISKTGTTIVPAAVLAVSANLHTIHLSNLPLDDINLIALIKISPSLKNIEVYYPRHRFKALDSIEMLWVALCQQAPKKYRLSIYSVS